MKLLRRYFIAGLVTLVPVIVTALLISWLVELSDRAMLLLPERYQPDALLGFHLPGLGVVVALLALVGIGAVATNFIGSRIIAYLEGLFARVPVVRGIYGAMKQLVEAVFGSGGEAFRKVVLVPFPQKGQWTIGFVTGPARLGLESGIEEGRIAVFVPTTPNPTSGWLLFVDEADVVSLPVSVEEGMKIVVSGGVIAPAASRRE